MLHQSIDEGVLKIKIAIHGNKTVLPDFAEPVSLEFADVGGGAALEAESSGVCKGRVEKVRYTDTSQ